MKPIHEVITDYTDDDNYTHIDVYHSSDPNSSGKSVAIVCRDTKKVYYIDNMYRRTPQVDEAIANVLKDLNQ